LDKIKYKDKQFESLHNEYKDLACQVATKTLSEPIYNTAFIIHNFRSAHEFDKIMKQPLTEEEDNILIKDGIVIGAKKSIN
jgi:hypothetical protein